jgi:hypothetical protein
MGYQPQEAAVLGFKSEIPSDFIDFIQLPWPLLPAYFILNTVITWRLQKTDSNWRVRKVGQTTLYVWDQTIRVIFEE